MVKEMGFDTIAKSPAKPSLWQQYEDEFPVRRNLVYLNHAAVAPLSRRAAGAIEHLAADCLEYGSLHYSEWLAA